MSKHLLAEKSLFLPRVPVHKVRLKEKKEQIMGYQGKTI